MLKFASLQILEHFPTLQILEQETFMPKKSIQEQLDDRISSRRAAQIVEDSELPTFTPEIFERDNQETALVECNFKDMSARLVKTSGAPRLTTEVLQTLGKPIKTVELFFEDSFFQVAVRDGIPLALEIQQLKLMTEYADREKDPVVKEERNIELSRLLLSGMLVDPQFSYRGRGEGIPIETRSRVMLDSFAEAFAVVNQIDDAIYQVTVRRGVPADAFAITGGETFEFYPVGKQKKYLEMSGEELSAEMARNTARRRVLVPAMIVDPQLSYTPVDEDAEIEVREGEPYPVGLLSERFLKTLFNAHRVINVPAAGVSALARFSRRDGDEPTSENSDGESVDKQQGGGETAE